MRSHLTTLIFTHACTLQELRLAQAELRLDNKLLHQQLDWLDKGVAMLSGAVDGTTKNPNTNTLLLSPDPSADCTCDTFAGNVTVGGALAITGWQFQQTNQGRGPHNVAFAHAGFFSDSP